MAALLSEAGIVIHRHADYFDAEEDDDEIIKAVAFRGWVIIAGDKNYETDHLFEIWQSNAKVVLFSENNSGSRIWTGILALYYEKILDACADAGDQSVIIRLGKSGISLIRSHEEIKGRFRELQRNEIQRQKRGQPTAERTARRAPTDKAARATKTPDKQGSTQASIDFERQPDQMRKN